MIPIEASPIEMPATVPGHLQVGAVRYLNTKPLIHTLEERLPEQSSLSLELPSRLASQLAEGNLDYGLIPIVEFFRGPESEHLVSADWGIDRSLDSVLDERRAAYNPYEVVSDACIACRGKVRSVRLFFRRPPSEVRTMAVDEGSRTSVTLATLLLWRRFGILPKRLPLPIDSNPSDAAADAVLVIGDRAMHPSEYQTFLKDWDLGEEWVRETGLPFVFAAWIGRKQNSDVSCRVANAFEEARDEGVRAIPELASQYASTYRLTVDDCIEYLSENLCFQLGEFEWAGLKLFYELADSLPGLGGFPKLNMSQQRSRVATTTKT